MGIKPNLELSKLKCSFVPRPKLLKQLDPDNAKDMAEVWDFITQLLETFIRLTKDDHETYQSMSLNKLLDVSNSFLHLESGVQYLWSALPRSVTSIVHVLTRF